MNFNDLVAPVLGGLLLLVVVDTALGAASAVAGGTFQLEYLYAVARTKGLALTQVAILLLAGAATPYFNFKLLGIETDPFSAIGTALAIPLAASLVASILDNVGKRDSTLPQGVQAPALIQAPVTDD